MNPSDKTFLQHYLADLGFDRKQSEIFLTTFQYGPKAASTIASLCHTERSYCYKVLEELVQQGLVEQIMMKGVKHYHISSCDVLLQKIQSEHDRIQGLKTQYTLAKSHFDALLGQKAPYIPKTQQYEGVEGIRQRYDDMISTIASQEVIVVKCCMSTLFASQVTRFADIQVMYDEFVDRLRQQHIHLQGFVGTGSLIVEHMHRIDQLDHIQSIAIGNQSIQLRVVGEYLYIGLFRQFPIGIKLRSPDMSDLLQTMMEFMVGVAPQSL